MRLFCLVVFKRFQGFNYMFFGDNFVKVSEREWRVMGYIIINIFFLKCFDNSYCQDNRV